MDPFGRPDPNGAEALPGESTPSSSSASWSLEDGLLRFVVAGPTLVATWGEPAADQASETAGG